MVMAGAPPHAAQRVGDLAQRDPASTQARMRGSTFSVPAAAAVSAVDGASAAPGRAPARTAWVRATWRASRVRVDSLRGRRCSSPASAKALTPTTIASPASTARWNSYAACAISPCW